MTCTPANGSLQAVFGKDEGQIVLTDFNARSIKVQDNLADKGLSFTFEGNIARGGTLPETDSFCIIRKVVSSGFQHVISGLYEVQAAKIKAGPYNYLFTCNSLLPYAQEEDIEDYSATTTWTEHIRRALDESGAHITGYDLRLLDLQTIVGDTGEPFTFSFKLGKLENFLDDITKGKGRWRIKALPFLDWTGKTSGAYGEIEIILNGATENRATPYRLNPLISSCPAGDYLSFMGEIPEQRGKQIANRFIVDGRNGRKLAELPEETEG